MATLLNKKVIVAIGGAVVVLLVLLSVYMFSSDSVREPDSFRGIRWGTIAGSVSGLTLLAEDGDLKFYENKSDKMKLEGADVDKIVYGFHKDRFYNVIIYFHSADNLPKIKQALTRLYGDPVQPDPSAKKYFWNGPNVNLLLSYDDAGDMGRIAYLFKPIQLESELKK